jgi:hypothetical protein
VGPMRARRGSLLLLAAALCACSEDVNLDDADRIDAGACAERGDTECSNCVDDDGDGLVDGDDAHCAGPLDDDEATFATGIPGDNKDRCKQDCFFDGNSGDQCQIDTCCLLSAETCEAGGYGDPTDCDFDQECIDACVALTPPGCDCFGCCTICNPITDQCVDVLTNPAVSEGCDFDALADPAVCVPCTKLEVCSGGSCDPQNCVLCPGQTEEDLPAGCGDMNECPGAASPCNTSGDCGDGDYCSNSCCVDVVE